ncbi:MAG: hypothetical protein HWN69_02160 [Desulfobacterales bacterium]|nr:hypothetical protein [Desulfobacterales bacterium]
MIETNIRIVYPGKGLYVSVKDAEVKGSDLSVDLLERACGRLRYQQGLASILCPGPPASLLVATSRPIPTMLMEDEDWELEISDAGRNAWRLTLSDQKGETFLPLLIERALMAKLARHTKFWTLDSPRNWYEPEPFCIERGISVYRRYRIAGLPLGDQGIGIAVDVGTAFFTVDTLAYFFDPDVSRMEQQQRERLFDKLTNRQRGQKGTLLYDNSKSQVKCYFESAPPGITCATTGIIRAKGHSYDSLYDYYKAVYPKLKVNKDAQAVSVSFSNIRKPQWVAAQQVRVRVMNDSLPRELSSIDKIKPNMRRELLQGFWAKLGSRPFGPGFPSLYRGFWRPKTERVRQFSIPDLTFGRDKVLSAPSTPSAKAYRSNYMQRLEYLEEIGCYYVPPDMPRTLHFAYPNNLDGKICEQFASDLTQAVRTWTAWAGCSVQAAQPIGYDSVSSGIEKLRTAERDGIAVFVLSAEPTAYHEVAFQLERWRVKRITEHSLQEHYQYLKEGYWSKKKKALDLASGKRRWEDFVKQNAL